MKIKVLSFDIEVLPIDEKFPVADKCPIIMMSLCGNYEIVGEKKKVVMILDRNGKEEREDRGEYILARFATERRMIEVWENILKRSDVIVGYNCNGFDFPYIIDRCRVLGFSIKAGMGDDRLWHKDRISKGMKVVTIGGMKGKIVFDVLYMLRRGDSSNVFLHEYNLKNLTLDWVSGEILGEEKGKLKFDVKDMLVWWNTGAREEDFIAYGLRDAEVVLEMVQKFRLLDRFIMLSRKSGKLLQDVIDSTGFGGLVENLLMKEFHKEERVVPTRSVKSENRSGFGYDDEDTGLGGAYVLEPKLGITDNLGSCDYSGLYPSLIIKHNLCYSTFLLDNIPVGVGNENVESIESEEGIPYGKFVKKDIYQGILPRILIGLKEERVHLKGLMKKCEKGSVEYIMYDASQNAAKILMNSVYGYTGEKIAKLYSWAISNSVTSTGRKQIKGTILDINKYVVSIYGVEYKMGVVQSDTDSCYVRVIRSDGNVITRDEVVKCMNEVIEKINLGLEKPMELSFENYIRRLLVTAKKRYTMLVEDEKGRRSIVNKGIESVRRDWCDYATDCMDNVIETLLEEEDVGSGIKKSIQLVRDESEKLIDGKIDLDKLVLSKKLSKLITGDYKAVHVSVAKKMVARGKKADAGDRISYIITNNGKKLISEKAEEVELVKEGKFKVDTDYYIHHQLLPPVMRVFDVLGVKDKSILEDRKQMSLFDY